MNILIGFSFASEANVHFSRLRTLDVGNYPSGSLFSWQNAIQYKSVSTTQFWSHNATILILVINSRFLSWPLSIQLILVYILSLLPMWCNSIMEMSKPMDLHFQRGWITEQIQCARHKQITRLLQIYQFDCSENMWEMKRHLVNEANDSLYELMIVRFKIHSTVFACMRMNAHTLFAPYDKLLKDSTFPAQNMPASENNRKQIDHIRPVGLV